MSTTYTSLTTTTRVSTAGTTITASPSYSSSSSVVYSGSSSYYSGSSYSSSVPPSPSYVSSTLSYSSTSVYATTSTVTSDGVVYTTLVSVTSVLPPGAVVVSQTNPPTSGSSSNNLAAIIGGVVGGVALLLLLIIAFLLLRRRRIKHEFDGNFDPHISDEKRRPNVGGGGTLPQMNVEDDGMGGRLGAGPGGGGVISPFPFASPPVANTSPSSPPRPNMQMGHGNYLHAGGAGAAMMGAAAGAAYANNDQSPQSHHQRMSSTASSGQYPNYFPQRQSQYDSHFAGQPVSPTGTGTTVPNGVGYPSPYVPPFGRGPSPGPSMIDNVSQAPRNGSEYSSSAGGPGVGGASLGMSAKEMEAMGGNPNIVRNQSLSPGMPLPHVANPDEFGQYQQQQPQQQQMPGGYFQPGMQNQYYAAGSSVPPHMAGMPAGPQSLHNTSVSTVAPVSHSPPPQPQPQPQSPPQPQPQPQPQAQPLVHTDRGPIEDPDAPEEVPPPYDSLPQDIRQ